jgi:hypothetical protein
MGGRGTKTDDEGSNPTWWVQFLAFCKGGRGSLSGHAITGRVCEYQVFHTALNGKEAPVPYNSSYAFWIRARFPTRKGMRHLRLEIFTIFVMLVLFSPALGSVLSQLLLSLSQLLSVLSQLRIYLECTSFFCHMPMVLWSVLS